MKRLLTTKIMYGIIILFALSALAGTAQAGSTAVLTITASPAGGGSTTGAGTYPKQNSPAITATPSAGYRFVNWTGPDAGQVANVNAASTTISLANADRTIQANFIRIYTISGNTGTGGVTLGGLSVTSDGSGNYTATVDTGFSGTVTPSKTGYAFTPATRTYSNVTSNQTSQNYTALGLATTANPADDAIDVSLTPTLSWTAGSGATSHDVYFGTNSASLTFIGNQAGTTYTPATLSTSRIYYWRIDEKNASSTATGTLWSFTTVPTAPGQATTPNPANAATNISLTPTLSWTAGSGATSHNVYLGTNSASPTSIGNQAGTTYAPSALATSTTYYWRIDEQNTGGTTTGTVWSFTTVPPAPGLATASNPANAATNISLTPTLSWTAGSGATSHNVYFGTNSASPTSIGNQAGATYTPAALSTSRTYYWRIDEQNTGGTTTGTLWSFTTVPPAPGLATTPNPANAATNISLTPTLSWTAGSGTPSHDVYFGTNSASLTFIGNQAGTTYTPAALSTSVTYYWRIDEKNAGGTTTGTLWNFTTVPPPPAQATAANPADDAIDVSLTPTLSWTAGSGATSHDVYFGTNSASPTFIGNQASATYTPAALSTSRTYYWRIDEKNAGGTTTGTLWSFTTVPPAPGLAITPNPANAATNVSLTPTLSWTAGSGATSHDVYFGTNSASLTSIGNQSGTTYTPGTLLTSRTYYWRINEKNTGGTTTGTLWSFTTVPPPPGIATTPNPTNAATNVSLTPTLSWTTGSGATSHDVYFGTNSANPTSIGNQAGATYSPGTLSTTMTYYWRIDEKNTGGTTTGTVWSFTTVPPPPGLATTPSPVDTAADVSLTPTLSWTAASDATSHDVYFGTNSASPTLIGNQAGTTYTPAALSTSRTYYWRINEKNPGGTTTGTLWRFTTVPPAPGLATTPNPANAATNVSKAAILSWTAGSGTTSHDVYFGTVSPGTLQGNQTGTTFNPGTMSNGTTYYWRINEKNTGGTTTGTVWSFTVLPTRTLTASAGSGGTVTAPGVGSFPYDNGTVVSIAATADTNYHFVNWTGTGVTAGKVANANSASTTIIMDGNYTVVANFAIDQYNVTASAGSNGSISPSGTIAKDYGSNQTFTATPSTGYQVDTWSLDGTGVQTGGNSYTLNNVTATHTVSVTFKLLTYTVTTSAGSNGTISPTNPTVNYNANQAFTATPSTGYEIDKWSVDGSDAQTGGTTYTLSNITATHTVAVSFKILTYTVTASAGTNGSISPTGAVTKDYGSNEQFTATPATGYEVDKWSVDGSDVQTGSATYTLSGITATHTVAVSFKILTYQVTASAGSNGSISPTGAVTKDYGSSEQFTATPTTGYEVDKWSVDGSDVQTGGATYTLSNITATHTVAVSFKILTYQVTASAGANGSIDPVGSVTKDYGTSQLFTATPATGYEVDKWSVDGSGVQTGGATYTLSNITATHTVAVSFKILTYQVTASAGANGSIDPVGSVTKDYGTSQLFTATPATGYEVDKWSIDGSDVQTGGTTYTLSGITATHTVAVSFKILTYMVTASAGANGSIDPVGDVTKNHGSSQLFTATPITGYEVDKWSVDGSDVQTGGTTYTLSDITATHTVAVSFKILTYTVTASAGTNGSIDPVGDVTKDYGTSQLFTATPTTGYEVDKWSVDGSDVQTGGTTYTLSDITATHTVAVSFKILTYTVTASAGANGSIDPVGDVTKDYGTSQLFAATPTAGYEVDKWSVDGSDVQTGGTTYTLSDITATHTVAVSFKILTYTVTASADIHGSVGPVSIDKDYGSDQMFTALPDTNYEVDKWSVDGAEVQTGGLTYTLSDITATHTVSVTFKLSALIISGYIIEPDGNTPVIGAVVDANNNGGSIGVTDANGYYELTVPPGWSGTATPIKAGYSFEPYKMDYSNVAANTEKDYAATPLTYIISGHIMAADGITPFADVNVIADNNGGPFTTKYGKVSNDGGPCLGRFGSGSAVTDANGYYEVMVDYNWAGKVTAAKYAYAFPDRTYTSVIADQSGQNFTGEPMTFAISGHILNNCNVPIQGVTVSADNGGNTVVTDANGFYEVWVSFNWSGTVTVDKTLYTFAQSNTGYTDVLSNQTNQDYHGGNIYDLDCDNAIGYGDIAVISENWLSETTGNICDLNADGIVNFMDYAKFANIWTTEGK